MKRRSQRLSGFTITEFMVALTLAVVIAGSIMAAYVQGLLVVQQEQIYSELQLDLEKATERIRHDLRLSSVGISMMSFYPTNSSRFTAISMPLSRDTNGLVKVDTNGRVVWNQTVIYHVLPGDPDRLLRTVFEPRYANAAELLYEQLARVASASSTSEYVHACLPFGAPTESVRTDVVFANLVDIEFTCGLTNNTYDCYSPVPAKGNNTFGSIVLGPGEHTVDFRVVGKNPASSGLNFGLDRLAMSPSRSPREGEMFDPIHSHPAAPHFEYSVLGAGTARAYFEDATVQHPIICNLRYENGVLNDGVRLKIRNDLWCDTTFDTPGALASNCSVRLDYAFTSSPPYIPDWVVSPDKGIAWMASSCGTGVLLDVTGEVRITNVVYGVSTNHPLSISRNGCWARFYFERDPTTSLLITNAVVRDTASGIVSNLTFDGRTGVYLPANGPTSTNSDWVPLWEISTTGQYEVACTVLQGLPSRGAPAFADIDSDGDNDLFVGDGEGRIRFYPNLGTPTSPSFPLMIGEWQSIEVSSVEGGCNLTFGDVDGDADLDLFIGLKGGSVPSGYYFIFYRNVGNPTNAVMVAEPSSYQPNPCQSGSMNATPALVDLDADGQLDFAHGWRTTTFPRYFKGSTNPPVFSPVGFSSSDFTTGEAGWPVPAGPYGNNSAPAFVDIDGDGDFDLFSGQGAGGLSFWENVGTPSVHSFTFRTDDYFSIRRSDYNSMPAFVDIDGDGDFDLFTGGQDGTIHFYENTGSATNAAWTLRSTDFTAGTRYMVPSWMNDEVFALGYPLSYVNGTPTNRLVVLSAVEVGYPREATYRSGVLDTRKQDPAYNELHFTRLQKDPAGTVAVRVRASDSQDMAGASWTDARMADDGYFSSNVGNLLAGLPRKRYLQYEARLRINPNGTTPWAHTNESPAAVLRDVTVDWPGATALVDLNVDFDLGPDGGIVMPTVDGEWLVESVGVTVEIYKRGRTGTNTVRGTLVVRPLNTRR